MATLLKTAFSLWVVQSLLEHLRISIHKIDTMVIQHLPIFLWQVILNHGSNRKIFLKV
jgi:uncharacterized protein with PQ loop repeat